MPGFQQQRNDARRMAPVRQDPGAVLRLGIVGLGGATRQTLPSLVSHPSVSLVAGADTQAGARAAFGRDYGARTYDSVEALCDSPDVDAVYIATPHQWHKAHAVAAAMRGKHVIVEKPMALNLADCDAMIEAADRYGVWMVVGHTHGFNAPVKTMREILLSGALGRLAMIHTWNYTNFLYRPRRPEELRTELGGGIIYNQVPHQVDIVRLLGGGMVRSVRAMAWALDPARPTEGSHVTFLEFEDGAAASLVYSGHDYFDSDEFHGWIGELGEPKPDDRHGSARRALRRFESAEAEAAAKTGTSASRAAPAPGRRHHHPHFGITVVSGSLGEMRPSADGIWLFDQSGRTEVPVPPPRVFPDKSGVIDELCEAVWHGRPPVHDGAWGKATMEVCEAILTSARERREVMLAHQVPANDGQTGRLAAGVA